ncbi:MAG: signal peptidase I [Clostridia bacterium]|nr:signal peptidase I [Clostridia bacterium]
MSNEPEKMIAAENEAQLAENTVKGKKNKKEKEKKTFKQELLSWVYTLLAALVIVTVIRTFFFEPIRVDGESMQNTLLDGDVVLVTKPEYWSGDYERGDIIICRYPNRNKESSVNLGGSFELTFTNHTLFVKRLIGLPGDKVEFRAGVLYVNDQMVDESHIDVCIPTTRSFGPIVLGADQYFVVGDNRGNSNDSRAVGPISEDMIVGHVNLVIWPLSNFGKVQ